MKHITVLFKTHLDIGFTALAAEVAARYPGHIRAAVATADYFRAKDPSPTGFRYRWTVGSWLVDSILRGGGANAAFLEKAIRAGDVVWHALPFTTESELAGLAAFRAGLGRSLALDRRFGRRTRAAKLTDVPGHTRGIVGPLAEAGVSFLHIGTNPGCGVCRLPELFRWRDAEGREIIVAYQTEYGRLLALPGGDEAFLVCVAGDNHGAHTPEEVEAILAGLRRDHPGAEITGGTFDDLADALEPHRDALPLVTSEIGSTWIHGFASDPVLTARYRECLRFAETLPPDVREPFLRELELVAEHTCGVDVKKYLTDRRHWTGAAIRRLGGDWTEASAPVRGEAISRSPLRLPQADGSAPPASGDGGFAIGIRSWREQRAYIDKAARTLPPKARKALEMRLSAASAQSCRPPLAAGRPLESPHVAAPHFTFDIDAERGCLRDLRAADGTRLFREAFLFGGERFGPANYEAYHRNYLRLRVGWTLNDFGHPGMPRRAYRLQDGFPARAFELPCDDGRRILLRSRRASVFAKAWELELALPDDAPELRATLRVLGKDPSRAPHALWLSFAPARSQGGLSFTKLGEPIDPADVVEGGGRALHAIDGEIRLGGGAVVETLDAPLLAPGARDLLWKRRNPLPQPGAPFHVNLYNNVWGTNFPQWFGGNAAYRFTIRYDKTR